MISKNFIKDFGTLFGSFVLLFLPLISNALSISNYTISPNSNPTETCTTYTVDFDYTGLTGNHVAAITYASNIDLYETQFSCLVSGASGHYTGTGIFTAGQNYNLRAIDVLGGNCGDPSARQANAILASDTNWLVSTSTCAAAIATSTQTVSDISITYFLGFLLSGLVFFITIQIYQYVF